MQDDAILEVMRSIKEEEKFEFKKDKEKIEVEKEGEEKF